MKPHERIKAIFGQALPIESAAERESFLESACKDDIELRQQVEALLAAHVQAGDFLSQTIKLPPPDAVIEPAGMMIGRYKLLEKIGEGGFGVVYMAEQQEPVKRKVALKIIKPGMDTREVITRFEAERQALALMDHANIAKVLDGGTTEAQRPYFVMELVRGVPLTDYCDQNNLSTAERLQLFVKVCQAVQHAHQKAIIHRDLKPSNVLVTVHDGDPVPKVIDFGVAKALGQKLTEKTLFTGFAQMMGTPAYMSPEQAEMSGLDVDTRSDIYSLGVLLYELLTGATPFDSETLAKAALDEVRRMIRETDPPKPSTRLRTLGDKLSAVARHRRVEPAALSRLMRGDLDWIVMKCLEKDRTRRYETANGLARDIHRFLHNEPVSAAAPSTLYRALKFTRRHQAALVIAGTLATLLAGGVVVSTWEAVRARHAETREKGQRDYAITQEQIARRQTALAEAEKLAAQQNLYAADMFRAQRAIQEGNFGLAQEALLAHLPRSDGVDLRGFEWHWFSRNCEGDKLFYLTGHSNTVKSVALSPNGKWIAAATSDHIAKIWDFAGRKLLATVQRVDAVAFSVDSRFLFTAAPPDQIRMYDTTSFVQVSSYSIGSLPPQADPNAQVAASPVGTVLAACTEGDFFGRNPASISLIDYSTGKVIQRLQDSGDRMSFSADGKTLATGGSRGAVRIWDMPAGTPRATLAPAAGLGGLALSPDGRWCATTEHWLGDIHLWDVLERKRIAELKGHSRMAWAVVFSPDGKLLASGSSDQTIRLWDVINRRQVRTLRGHSSEVWSLAFSADGRFLVSGSKDQTVAVWEVTEQPSGKDLRPAFTDTHDPIFSPDSHWLATASPEQSVTIWSLSDLEIKAILPNQLLPVALGNGGRTLTTLNTEYSLETWDADRTNLMKRVALQPRGFDLRIGRLCPDGRTFAGGSENGNIGLWDTDTGNLVKAFQALPTWITALVFSPDGRLAAACSGRAIKVWNCASWKELATMTSHNDGLSALTFSPDSRVLVSGSIDNTAKLWSTTNFSEIATLRGHEEGVLRVAISSDNRTLATASGDKTVKLWHLPTLREMATFQHPDSVNYVGFSPDNRTMAYGCSGSAIQILSAWPIRVRPKSASSPPVRQQVENLARRGCWKEALTTVAKVADKQSADHMLYHTLAPLLTADGDLEGYRRVCQRILAQFSGATNPFVADRMAKDCLILCGSGTDLGAIGVLADTAVTRGQNQSALPYFQCTKSLAEYRQGHYENAVDWARKSLDNPSYPADASRFVEAYMVLAMAQYQLTQTNEACTTLAKGMAKADELTKLESGIIGDGWRDWIIAHALMKEANTLIKGEAAAPTYQSKEN
jgi:WD40 repeat protein/tRNA A-37 threonylcarbamoyl transferase component Bud32